MPKKIAALVFLLSFALQTFSRTLIIADYLINTKSYAQTCENKAKPVMHCNGKCQMMKKLKQEEKKDEQNPERKSDNKNETVLSSKSFYPDINILTSTGKICCLKHPAGKEIKMPRSLLRPPIF